MNEITLPEPCAPLPDPPFKIDGPSRKTTPILVASPHSGRSYPCDFVAASRLDFKSLRRSEDSFVDELLADSTTIGIPLLKAEFPRAYCDVNREPWELDPVMFADKLPAWCNTNSARVLAGFGTIARLVASGEPIYRNKLSFSDAEQRIRICWKPYHAALAHLIAGTVDEHGTCLLLDAHSMPSLLGMEPSVGRRNEPDFVLGDAFGTSCAHAVTQFTEGFLRDRGFRVRRNDPYAGGYVTRHYGKPAARVHVLQLEVCRSLYMDESGFAKLPRFHEVQALLASLLGSLAQNIHTLLAKN